MCGRARCTLRVEDVGRACGFGPPLRAVDSDRFRPSFNVAPGRYMPVVRHALLEESKDSMEPVVQCMKWGLIPSFTKKKEKPDHFRMFNARSESVHIKSSFRKLLQKNRCLTTVEGFYEWKKDGSKRQPYYLHLKDGSPLVFAALYDSWKDDDGITLYTFTILTTRVSKALDWLHDRMPVILSSQEAINGWLKDDLSEAAIHKLTLPYEGPDLVWYPVTSAMGKPSYDCPECVQEIKPKVASESPIAQLFGKKNSEVSSQSTQPSLQRDDDWEIAEDRKALLAAMDPDRDVPEAPQDANLLAHDAPAPASVTGDRKDDNSNTAVVDKGSQDVGGTGHQQLGESSPEKQRLSSFPDAKRKRLSVSAKSPKNAIAKDPLPDKQSSLLSFFPKR